MAQDISQLLECQICSESFDEFQHKPKILPCCHTICLKCLRQMTFRDHPSCQSRSLQSGLAAAALNSHLKIKCPNDNRVFHVPLNDVTGLHEVANFPNDTTMMARLEIASAKGTDQTSAAVPTDHADETQDETLGSDHTDDIKDVLERRVKKLQQEAIRVKNDIVNSPLSCEKEIAEARESIRAAFQEIKNRFMKTIEDKQATLMAGLDSFSEKQQEKRINELTVQLNEVTEFCNDVKRELSQLCDEKASEYLVRCVKMDKKTKLAYQNFKSNRNHRPTVYSSTQLLEVQIPDFA